ncbi:DUF1214 domain-containing protein [Variovorax sp. J22R133]|uniref:DUF1254 domain-containing protein n=1 Tax=Variovorax brevis TaxID=3053503 RepID=UPI0025757DCF|nr:DUF1214 domain-containing protein [Variovorax sp. J22R133]MDM0114801.1 DUF1214 domain-containing protein [Variovorax sp. J22R133]
MNAIDSAIDWREDHAYHLGMQAYAYGFPAMYYAKLRFGMVMRPQGQIDTPLNTFFHITKLGDHTLQYGGSPYRDGLYSIAWIDVKDEPVVLSAPACGDRYVSIQLAEFHSDLLGYAGGSVNEGAAQTCLIVAPDWQGEKPAGIDVVIRSTTPGVFGVARVATPGGDDLEAAQAIQQLCKLTPLSNWLAGTEAAPRRNVLVPTAPDKPLADFHTMHAALCENPPPASHDVVMRQFGRIGLGPFARMPLNELDDATKRGLERALKDGPALLAKVAKSGGDTPVINTWFWGDKNWGRMGAVGDYLGRAAPQAFSGIVEHWIEQSTKLRTFTDATGAELNGANDYVLRFEREQIPQARAFWSITLYDERFNLADNPIGRYSIASNTAGLQYGADGSLEIYLQHAQPEGDRVANWLPTPKGAFNLFLRTYLPGANMLDQSYAPPAVRRV